MRSIVTCLATQPSINHQEAAYIQEKAQTSVGSWHRYLSNSGLDIDVAEFVPSRGEAVAGVNLPIISIAVSGGGLRSHALQYL